MYVELLKMKQFDFKSFTVVKDPLEYEFSNNQTGEKKRVGSDVYDFFCLYLGNWRLGIKCADQKLVPNRTEDGTPLGRPYYLIESIGEIQFVYPMAALDLHERNLLKDGKAEIRYPSRENKI